MLHTKVARRADMPPWSGCKGTPTSAAADTRPRVSMSSAALLSEKGARSPLGWRCVEKAVPATVPVTGKHFAEKWAR